MGGDARHIPAVSVAVMGLQACSRYMGTSTRYGTGELGVHVLPRRIPAVNVAVMGLQAVGQYTRSTVFPSLPTEAP